MIVWTGLGRYAMINEELVQAERYGWLNRGASRQVRSCVYWLTRARNNGENMGGGNGIL